MKLIILLMISLSLLRAEYIRNDSKNVVLDTKTNLMWQDSSTPSTMTWNSAIMYCEALTLGNYGDWRLPNFNELYHLSDKSTFKPALNQVFRNIVDENYWSSTTYIAATDNKWFIDFDDGNDGTNDENNYFYVRCVR